MAQKPLRKNEQILVWLKAVGIGAVTWLGLAGMNVQPGWLPIVGGILAASLTFVGADLGVLAAVILLSIPLVAAQPLLGIAALVIGVIAVRYLGADGGRAFFVIAISLVGAFFGPVWAGAALAGYLLGVGEGALAAAVACIVVEAVGVLLGKPVIGATITGGPVSAIVSFAHMPATLLSAEWLRHAFSSLGTKSVNHVIGGFRGVRQPAALVAQPAIWALGAAAAGAIGRRRERERGNLALGLVAVAVGVAVPAAGGIVMRTVLGLPQALDATVFAALTSLAVALVFVAVWESAFSALPVAPVSSARRVSVASEDADVDELLRLIASAEDKLATEHTTNKIVMITDMKSFSRMTEEDGSVVTAKAIQRHRDLLIPILERNGGKGKSTGGDGLVAAFNGADQAIRAAIEMQLALAENNAAHPNEREIRVRIGLASGEVVLDKGGRPFIGGALNLAARVMNLADGGQVFASGDVASSAPAAGARRESFGEFELKNIARPVEVVEILWADDQAPHDPRQADVPADV